MTEPTRIYLASSWRNPRYPRALEVLRAAEFDVYDFRNEEAAFRWDDIDSGWWNWNPEEIRKALDHPLAERAFEADRKAIGECDVLVMLMPCGKSAHTEFGYAAGLGKTTVIVLAHDITPDENARLSRMDRLYLGGSTGANSAEVMYRLADHVCLSIDEAARVLAGKDGV